MTYRNDLAATRSDNNPIVDGEVNGVDPNRVRNDVDLVGRNCGAVAVVDGAGRRTSSRDDDIANPPCACVNKRSGRQIGIAKRTLNIEVRLAKTIDSRDDVFGGCEKIA